MVSSPERGILVPPRLRDLGMVFQSYAVWPHMTVRQNVIYPLKHRNIARAEADRKVDEVLELVGLSEYADRPVVALSGGQMQRVALARSIVYRPQLLLLDEPLSNLDAKLRLRLRDDLRVILKQTGMTALYVTHDQAEAVVLGDRIGVMRDGKLLQIGTPDEIYNRPADLFVANFTGATNELTGILVERSGEFGVVDFGDGRRGEAALLHALNLGEKVRIALRPENIGIGRAGWRQHVSGPGGRSAAIRAHRPSTTSICSAGGWRCSNSAPQPAIRSGSRPRFRCRGKVAGRIVIRDRRLTISAFWMAPRACHGLRRGHGALTSGVKRVMRRVAMLGPVGIASLELIAAKPAIDGNDRAGDVARDR